MALSLVFVAAAGGVSAREPGSQTAVEQAIARAVAGRVGPGFVVRVVDLSTRLSDAASDLEARPVPGARLGQPVRFALFAVGTSRPAPFDLRSGRPEPGRGAPRVGDAVATVFVSGPAVKVVREIGRGERLRAEDLATMTDEIGGVPMALLPTMMHATGAEALRGIAAGAMLTATVIRVPPAVASGQVVTTVARVGPVNVESRAIAAERGSLGQMVRLVNPESRRKLRGMVVGPGRVEVLREP